MVRKWPDPNQMIITIMRTEEVEQVGIFRIWRSPTGPPEKEGIPPKGQVM
jgi:hypothetical protein